MSGVTAFVDCFEGIGIIGNDVGFGRRLGRYIVLAIVLRLVAVWGVGRVFVAIGILEGGVVIDIAFMVA